MFEGDVTVTDADPGRHGPHTGHRSRRHGRAGRGDVRVAIISLLGEQPSNGYQVIQEIDVRTGGRWRVSSGSVYPAMSQLEDEGLIEPTEENGRRLFALTPAGRDYTEQNAGQFARLWEISAEDAGPGETQFRDLIGQLAAAARQVSEVGTQAQREEAKLVLTRTRQSLYRLLAADPDEAAGPPGSL